MEFIDGTGEWETAEAEGPPAKDDISVPVSHQDKFHFLNSNRILIAPGF